MKRRLPDWLKVKIGSGEKYVEVNRILKAAKLHTICQEARCPNKAECFSRGTAVFLIMGDVCTRNCKYCNVKHGRPKPLDYEEPSRIAETVKKLGLKYVVITSVTRDDLHDGGALFFKKTIEEIRKHVNCKIEVLIPDLRGDLKNLRTIVEAHPDVVNHNIEVVKNLFPEIRPEGDYDTSLKILGGIKKIDENVKSKSGFMIGLGEKKEQIVDTIKDLRDRDVDFLTIGQYLQPSKRHYEVKKYYTPEDFKEIRRTALKIGFKHVESGPLVRSSYHADETPL